MTRDPTARSPAGAGAGKAPALTELPPAAQRALAEAQARREALKGKKPAAAEIGGPDGPEPTRYGDWETRGIASDF